MCVELHLPLKNNLKKFCRGNKDYFSETSECALLWWGVQHQQMLTFKWKRGTSTSLHQHFYVIPLVARIANSVNFFNGNYCLLLVEHLLSKHPNYFVDRSFGCKILLQVVKCVRKYIKTNCNRRTFRALINLTSTNTFEKSIKIKMLQRIQEILHIWTSDLVISFHF